MADRVLRNLGDASILDRFPALELRARAHAAAGDTVAAIAVVEEIECLAVRLGTPYMRARSLHVRADVLVTAGDHDGARLAAEDAADLFTACSARYDEACVRMVLSAALRALGHSARAEGESRAALEALALLRSPRDGAGPSADFFGPTSYADFQCSLDDPPGYRNYWTAENVVDLPDEAIDMLAERATELPAGPSQAFIVPWGGAVTRFGADHSPLAGREARFIVHPLLLWQDPADDARCRGVAQAFRADMAPWSTGAAYPNFLGDEGSVRMAAAFGASAERLSAVRAEWDPRGIFRTHQAFRVEPIASRSGADRSSTCPVPAG